MKHSTKLLITLSTFVLADTLHVPSEYPSIHAAIGAAQDGDTVLVAPGEYGGPVSFGGRNIVVLSTNGAYATLIRTFPWYHCVLFTGGEDSTAVLEGFTIRNTIADGVRPQRQDIVDHGGGLYITDSSPTIRDCIVNGCYAGKGAGLYMKNSSMRIVDCEFSYNDAATYGGGLYIGSADNGDPPRIIGCTITGNDAQ